MTKFLLETAKVRNVAAIVFIVASTANAEQTDRSRLSDSVLINNIIKKFVGPYVKSFQVAFQDKNITKRAGESDMEKEIEMKIDKLKPILDVNTGQENLGKSSEEETDDTKIIEFSPHHDTKAYLKNTDRLILRDKKSDHEPVKDHYKKYKKLQQKVKDELEKETISDKAKALVTKTLDELINELMSSQCTWRNRAEKPKLRNPGNFLRMDSDTMIDSWKKKWEELIDRYSVAAKNKEPDGSDYKEVFLFLLRLREFFFEIHDELNTMKGLYKVKCQVVDRENKTEGASKKFKVVSEGKSLRERPKGDNTCKYVKVCTGELKAFLTDYFFNTIETVDTVFKNYAEMYVRDINTATSKEKRSFVGLLKETNKVLGNKVKKAFHKEIDKLVLDVYNSTKAKVGAIKKCIKATSDEVQKLTDDVLKEQLKSLEAKMRLTVRKDLTTTMGIEIDNLESIFKNKMCPMFQMCNGNVTRRFFVPNMKTTDDDNTVFVKLNLGFDGLETLNTHETKATKFDTVDLSRRSGRNIKVNREDNKYATGYNRYQASNSKITFDPEKYLLNYTVTRTTYFVPMRKGTTLSRTIGFMASSMDMRNSGNETGQQKDTVIAT